MKTRALLADIALLNMDLGPLGGLSNEQAANRAEDIGERGSSEIFGFMREQLRGNIERLRNNPKSRVAQIKLSDTLHDIFWCLTPLEEDQ